MIVKKIDGVLKIIASNSPGKVVRYVGPVDEIPPLGSNGAVHIEFEAGRMADLFYSVKLYDKDFNEFIVKSVEGKEEDFSNSFPPDFKADFLAERYYDKLVLWKKNEPLNYPLMIVVVGERE